MFDFITGTLQAKCMFIMGTISIFITQLHQFNPTSLLFSVFMYLGVTYNANCLAKGGCQVWAWITLIVPIIATILTIANAMSPKPPQQQAAQQPPQGQRG